MTEPDVTFLIPIASPAPFLGEALTSIRQQSNDSWRVVAVIDGMDCEIEEQLHRTFPRNRLSVLVNEVRLGAAVALNRGLSIIGSKYIARLDSDDRNCPDRLDAQLQASRSWDEALVIGGAARIIDESGEVVGRLHPPAGADIRRRLLLRNQIVHSSALIRRDVLIGLGGYNGRCLLREDYELWLRLATLGQIGSVPDVVVDYRVSGVQSSLRRPPRTSVRYVGAARHDAAAALGMSRLSAHAHQLAWSAAQHPLFMGTVGGLARARRRNESRLEGDSG